MICENCGYETWKVFHTCPQCGTNSRLSDRCTNCGGPIDFQTYLYCPTCGSVNESMAAEEGLICDTHVENRAIGFCVICGRAVCDECAESSGRMVLCNDPNHKLLLATWSVIHVFDFEYEAAMLSANLDQNDIETEVFTKTNPDAADSATRPTVVTLMVPEDKVEPAREIAKSLGLDREDEEDEN